MKRNLSVAVMFGMSVLMSSCDKNIESSVLDAGIDVITSTVVNGGDFTFRIRTNQDAFVVKAVSCEFSDDSVLCVGERYTPKNGYCQYTFEKVSVSENHNSEVAVTISDEKTGIVRRLTGHFICKRY